jgi:hypothetical protein
MISMGKQTDRHRIYMNFMLSHGWRCQFLEEDLQTSLPRTLTFSSEDRVRELVERSGENFDADTSVQ